MIHLEALGPLFPAVGVVLWRLVNMVIPNLVEKKAMLAKPPQISTWRTN